MKLICIILIIYLLICFNRAFKELKEDLDLALLTYNLGYIKVKKVTEEFFIESESNCVYFHPKKRKGAPKVKDFEKLLNRNQYVKLQYIKYNMSYKEWIQFCTQTRFLSI